MSGILLRSLALFFLTALAIHRPAWAAEDRPLRQLLDESQSFAEKQQWTGAESAAREAVRRFPQSRDAQLRLAQVLLWRGDYSAARPMFARLVERDARDVEARLGLAQSEYWSGDYRDALREYEAILRLRPDHADAQRAVAEIRSAARPGYTVGGGGLSDDQPYRATGAGASAYFFSDPLTKWQIGSRQTRLRADGRTADVREFEAGGETALAHNTVHLAAALRWMQFPDSRSELLPLVSADRRFGRSRATVTFQRRELLRARAALRSHPFADVLAIRWSREEVHSTQFAASAESLRYFDGNRGASVDAYVLMPIGGFLLGASTSWKDTREPRFHADTGEYDPYWTPHDLREARVIAAASAKRGNLTFDLHLDGGIARDRVLYSPAETPSFARTFHPWRASLGLNGPLNARTTFHLSAERVSTVFYTANEIRAGVAGRF